MKSREKAVLAALRLPTQPRVVVEESLDELGRLAESAGALVVGRATQDRRAPTPALYFGKGKVEEIKTLSKREGADLMISDDSLSPIQERNLGGSLGVRVIDRTALILDIFAQRARTMEGKLQVELAQLSYLLPRLVRQWKHLERLGGGIKFFGLVDGNPPPYRPKLDLVRLDFLAAAGRPIRLRENRHHLSDPVGFARRP